MTAGQDNKKTILPSYANGMGRKPSSLHKKGLSFPTSTLRPWKSGKSAFSKTNVLVCSNIASNGTNKMKRTVSPLPSVLYKTCEITQQRRKFVGISKPGVYFENRRLSGRRHPAQATYNPFYVSKLPDIPVGTPLAKPPRLAFAKPGPLPFVPSPPPTRKVPSNIIESVLRPKKTPLHTPMLHMQQHARKVSMDKGDEEIEQKKNRNATANILTLKNNNVSSGSKKVLSKEERVFLKAATMMLSAAKI